MISPANRRRARTLTRKQKLQRAVSLPLFTLLLIPMVGFAALAADVGSWYARASELQRAADAGALAGVAHMPEFTQAATVATTAVQRNGMFQTGNTVVSSTATELVLQSNDGLLMYITALSEVELDVRIVDTDLPLFLAAVVIDNMQLERNSTAEFVRPVPMGSPNGFLANDPLGVGDELPGGADPNLWLATFGPSTHKRSGDQYHTLNCSGNSSVGCAGGINTQYAEDGYFFRVDVDDLTEATLGENFRIQIFDPVHHNYGDGCQGGQGGFADWLFLEGDVAAQPFYSTLPFSLYPEERYENARNNNLGGAAWCPGDNGLSGNYTMSVIVRAPSATPFDLTDDVVLCAQQFGSQNFNGANNTAEFVNRLTDPTLIAPQNLPFAATFREWATVCEIPPAQMQLGSYLVQIRTNADETAPNLRTVAAPGATSLINADSTISTGGRNRYSLRAGYGVPIGTPGGFGPDGAPVNPEFSNGVSIAANGRLPMFVNRPGGDGVPTEFFLARVGPEYAGQELRLEFFDLTDGSSIDVWVRPPRFGAGEPINTASSVFSQCDMQLERENGTTAAITETNCLAMHSNNAGRLTSGSSNGDSISATIVIPPGYDCNTADPYGCWVTVQMVFDGNPSDTTTWSASISGDPIHLTD